MRSKYLGLKLPYKDGMVEVMTYRTISDGALADSFTVKALDDYIFASRGELFQLSNQTIRRIAKQEALIENN